MDAKLRVCKLIALAESTHSEEEARTASREAVRLIARYSMLTVPDVKRSVEVWHGPIQCKPAWKGTCEVCRNRVSGRVVWLGKRVRHQICHERRR